jgi:hypothetical protein
MKAAGGHWCGYVWYIQGLELHHCGYAVIKVWLVHATTLLW